MVGSAAIKQGRSANRKHTYFFFFFWPYLFFGEEIFSDFSAPKAKKMCVV